MNDVKHEGVFNFLDCSTVHVTPADLDRLVTSDVLINYPYREGFFVHSAGDGFQETINKARAAGFSDEMIEALQLANKLGCWWLRLDADGLKYDFLQTFEEQWKVAHGETKFTVAITGHDLAGIEEREYESLADTVDAIRRMLVEDKVLNDGEEWEITIRKTGDLDAV